MKSFLQLAALCAFYLFSAQSVSDYGTLTVPKTFEKASMNKYDLRSNLIKGLKAKGYEISENRAADPCQILEASLEDSSNFLRNRVRVVFKDCDGKTIGTFDGTSQDKDFETGFPDALKIAMVKVPISNPKIIAAKKPEMKTETLTNTEKVSPEENRPTSQPALTSVNSSQPITYSKDGLTYNKVKLSATRFILVNPNQSVPYATFEDSGKHGVYRVKLENGTPTFGYDEGNAIIIEITEESGAYSRIKFSGK